MTTPPAARTALVVGASGITGSALVEHPLADGWMAGGAELEELAHELEQGGGQEDRIDEIRAAEV